MTQGNGGPAFPNNAPYAREGMSLRDWFAGHAPQAPDWWMLEEMPVPPPGWKEGDGPTAWTAMSHKWALSRIASWRFAYADAMIAERNAK